MAAALITSEILPRTSEENVQLRKNIYISSSLTGSEFYSVITDALDKIEENPIGKRLLDKISRCTNEIFIMPGEKNEFFSLSSGFHSFVMISTTEISSLSTTGELIPYPLYVILFHELVHAYHYLSFKVGSGIVDPLVWTSPEEYKTIMGFPSKNPERKTPKITENSFRAAEGLPLRGTHLMTDCSEWIKIRIRLLGKMYEQYLADTDGSQAPPPVIKYSTESLGFLPPYWLVYAEIRGINSDFTSDKDRLAKCIFVATNHFTNPKCYVNPFHSDSKYVKEDIAREIFPKLKDIETFTVELLMFLRITEEERVSFLSSYKQG